MLYFARWVGHLSTGFNLACHANYEGPEKLILHDSGAQTRLDTQFWGGVTCMSLCLVMVSVIGLSWTLSTQPFPTSEVSRFFRYKQEFTCIKGYPLFPGFVVLSRSAFLD
jgi:hypothetical protein